MTGNLHKVTLKKIKQYPKFHQKVWLECARIPRGKTVSYGQLAKNVGCPKGARAVAQALARNPFAPEVPCHRVIKSDGTIGGFSGSGGIKAKLKLLRKEGAL